MYITKFTWPSHGDDRGELIALETERDIPFQVKRVYYIYGVEPGVRRGFHAHIALEQVLVCVHGSCCIRLDDGQSTADVLLDSPREGLYIGHAVWREMYDFSPDAVLLVFASEHYDEADYIRNYEDFIKRIKAREIE